MTLRSHVNKKTITEVLNHEQELAISNDYLALILACGCHGDVILDFLYILPINAPFTV